MIKERLVLGCFITAEEEGQKFIVCLRRVLSKKENLSALLLIEFLLLKASQIQQTANYVSTFVRRGLENPIKCIKANGQSKAKYSLTSLTMFWPVGKIHQGCPGGCPLDIVQVFLLTIWFNLEILVLDNHFDKISQSQPFFLLTEC